MSINGPDNNNAEYFCVVINADSNRVLRWHRSDTHLLKRVSKLTKQLHNVLTDMKARMRISPTTGVTYGWFDYKGKELQCAFDYAFGEGASIAMFQGNHPLLTSAETGNYLIVDALEQLEQIIRKFTQEVHSRGV